ncbi:hypothetical protein LLG96_17030 [bacterium]|nr:hypothetical protein [bacterium]
MNKHIILTSFILTAVACLVIASAVMAQPPQFTPPTPESIVEQIDKAAKLSDDQKAQILKIYQDAAANAQQGGRRGGFFGGATLEAVEKVMTPDQVKKWREFTLKQSIDRRITQIDQAVTLTAEQKTKITPVIEKEVNAQNALMAEMRKQGENADREAMRDKMTEIRSATDKALESILTKDQLEKYNAMPRRGMRRQ